MASGVLDQHIIFEVVTLLLQLIIIIYCHKDQCSDSNSLNMQVMAFTNIANADIG